MIETAWQEASAGLTEIEIALRLMAGIPLGLLLLFVVGKLAWLVLGGLTRGPQFTATSTPAWDAGLPAPKGDPYHASVVRIAEAWQKANQRRSGRELSGGHMVVDWYPCFDQETDQRVKWLQKYAKGTVTVIQKQPYRKGR
jgi:hypothetical protein